MDLFLWLIILYFVIGFFAYFSMVKGVKDKITLIKADTNSTKSKKSTRSVVWWIVGIAVWGVVGIFLIVSWFLNHAG